MVMRRQLGWRLSPLFVRGFSPVPSVLMTWIWPPPGGFSAVKAIFVPSGDHAGSMPGVAVSSRGFRPEALAMKMWETSPGRAPTYASRVRSGE